MTVKTLPKGHKSILDRTFKYTPAADTDIKHTFIRIAAARAGVKVDAPPPVLAVVKGKRP